MAREIKLVVKEVETLSHIHAIYCTAHILPILVLLPPPPFNIALQPAPCPKCVVHGGTCTRKYPYLPHGPFFAFNSSTPPEIPV